MRFTFFNKGKDQPTGELATSGVPPKAEKFALDPGEIEVMSQIHTDAEFLQVHCRLMDRISSPDSAHVSHLPILESTFIERSAGSYAAPWAGRELVQNWIDAEVFDSDGTIRKSKGTLDGVTFKEEIMSDGVTKFTISGDWALTNLDGLVGLSSDKPDGPTSGGNGIGLKQTVLRFLRNNEFGVRNFCIYATSKQAGGTPVKISYEMISPEGITSQYAAYGTSPIRNIRKSWLVGKIENTDVITVARELPEHRESRDACAYVIETDNEKTIALLRGIKDFGVYSENPHLKDPNFESKKGTIVWGKDRGSSGKLFINGQVMDYQKKTTNELVFPGPPGVTIRLNEVDYPMSIDRPPISSIDLEEYTKNLLKDESRDVLIDLLKSSEHLWHLSSQDSPVGYKDSDGYNVVIESIIKNLLPNPFDRNQKKPPFSYDDFKGVFGDKYVYVESWNVKKEDIVEAEKEGYRVCLSEFAKLGVPSIKEVIDSSAKLKRDRPFESSLEHSQKFGWGVGTRIFYERPRPGQLQSQFTPDGFINKFKNISNKVFVDGKNIKIIFDIPAGGDLLVDDLAERDEDSAAENIIYSCRGLIASGLRTSSFIPESTSMMIDGRIVTFYFDDKKNPGKKGGGVLVGKIPEFDIVDRNRRNQIIVEFSLANEEDVKPWENLQGGSDAKVIKAEVAMENGGSNGDILVSAPVQQELSVSSHGGDDVDMVRKVLGEKLSTVPKVNPEDRIIIGSNSEITTVPVIISDDNVEKFKEVQKIIPHLKSIVNELEETVKSDEINPLTARERLMLQWVNTVGKKALGVSLENDVSQSSPDSEGLLEIYMKPNTLVLSLANILEANNQANVPISVPVIGDTRTGEIITEAIKIKSVGERIEAVARKFIPDAKNLEDFELITEPSQEQLKKLTLLRSVMLAMGYEANNDLFVFKGNNVKGFNLDQKAIGLHESVLEVGFKEAFAVFRHEIAHNREMDHNSHFIATDEAIASHVIEQMSLSANRLLSVQISLMRRGFSPEQIESEMLTKHAGDFLIVNASKIWEEMRGR